MTSYISTTVKILEKPREKTSKVSTGTTEVRVQICQVRGKPLQTLTTLIFLGNLSQRVLNYYQPNDHIIVEGYISIKNKKTSLANQPSLKYIEILVFKVYSCLLK